jgi:bifunctional enzyme CysN/CysC
VEITAADLTLFQTILDPTRIVTIWVGTNTSMDLSYEINLVESASIEESVPPIVQRLQDGGFIVENS